MPPISPATSFHVMPRSTRRASSAACSFLVSNRRTVDLLHRLPPGEPARLSLRVQRRVHRRQIEVRQSFGCHQRA